MMAEERGLPLHENLAQTELDSIQDLGHSSDPMTEQVKQEPQEAEFDQFTAYLKNLHQFLDHKKG